MNAIEKQRIKKMLKMAKHKKSDMQIIAKGYLGLKNILNTKSFKTNEVSRIGDLIKRNLDEKKIYEPF